MSRNFLCLFEVLADPPKYEPTRCSECGKVIVLGQEGYSIRWDQYSCEARTGGVPGLPRRT